MQDVRWIDIRDQTGLRQPVDMALELLPKRVQWPAGFVRVFDGAAERCVSSGEFAQEGVLTVFKRFDRSNAASRQPAVSHLKLDTPNTLALDPKRIEMRFAALLGDLGRLVVNPNDRIAFAKGNGLRLCVVRPDCVLIRPRDEMIRLEIDAGQAVIECPYGPRNDFGLCGNQI
jgi:hypothetical protein